jgi:DNA-binding transcriptional LysR family regulator
MFFKRFGILLMALVFVAGCTSDGIEPLVTVEAPTKPALLQVGLSDSLSAFEPILYACATDVGVLVEMLPWRMLRDQPKDVFFVYGEAGKQLTEHVYQIGSLPLVMIVHPDNPVNDFSQNDLLRIYQGEITDWRDLSPFSSYGGEMAVWGYMPGSELQDNFAEGISTANLQGAWNVAPDPAAMVDQVALDTLAVGFVPAWAVTTSVRAVPLRDLVFEPLPILAMWQQMPDASQEAWLVCVQSSLPQTEE